MAVPQYVKNMDDAHLIELSIGKRLDVSGLFKLYVFIRPNDGPMFESDMSEGARDVMNSLGTALAMSLSGQVGMGLISGFTVFVVPVNFAFKTPPDDALKVKFDSKYGLKFPTPLEVAEEMAARGL